MNRESTGMDAKGGRGQCDGATVADVSTQRVRSSRREGAEEGEEEGLAELAPVGAFPTKSPGAVGKYVQGPTGKAALRGEGPISRREGVGPRQKSNGRVRGRASSRTCSSRLPLECWMPTSSRRCPRKGRHSTVMPRKKGALRVSVDTRSTLVTSTSGRGLSQEAT